jgi:uncharacterized membrane protein YgcG
MTGVLIIVAILAIIIATIAAARSAQKRKDALRETRKHYIETYVFPVALRLKMRQQFATLTDAQIDQIYDGLRQWFLLLANNPRKNFGMPSKAVDIAWHEFILITRHYETFCQQAFGRFLHHAPNEGNAEVERDALARTYALGPVSGGSSTGGARLATAGAVGAGALLAGGAAASVGLFDIDKALGIENGNVYSDAELSALTKRHAQQQSADSGGCSGGFVVDSSSDGAHHGDGGDSGGGDSGGGGDGGGGCGGGCGS